MYEALVKILFWGFISYITGKIYDLIGKYAWNRSKSLYEGIALKRETKKQKELQNEIQEAADRSYEYYNRRELFHVNLINKLVLMAHQALSLLSFLLLYIVLRDIGRLLALNENVTLGVSFVLVYLSARAIYRLCGHLRWFSFLSLVINGQEQLRDFKQQRRQDKIAQQEHGSPPEEK